MNRLRSHSASTNQNVHLNSSGNDYYGGSSVWNDKGLLPHDFQKINTQITKINESLEREEISKALSLYNQATEDAKDQAREKLRHYYYFEARTDFLNREADNNASLALEFVEKIAALKLKKATIINKVDLTIKKYEAERYIKDINSFLEEGKLSLALNLYNQATEDAKDQTIEKLTLACNREIDSLSVKEVRKTSNLFEDARSKGIKVMPLKLIKSIKLGWRKKATRS